MKKTIRVIALVLITSFLLTSFAVADVTRASDYISGTTLGITSNRSGQISLDCTVIGTNIMNRIGVDRIKIYTSSGTLVQTIYYTTSGYEYMMGYNTYIYSDTITCQVDRGNYYYAEVRFYAGNNSGGDYVTRTTSVVRT